MTIDPIVNAMLLAKNVFHILQQRHNESISSFETPNQAIRIISKDMDVATKKSWTQKWKKLEAKPWRTNVVTKVIRDDVVKKRIPIIDSSSSSESEVSIPPLEEKLYIMLEVAPKND